MRTIRFALVWAVLASALALTAHPSAQSLTADALFDNRVLHRIDISMHTRDLAELRAHFDENTFYPADLEWRGQRVRNVAVRSRGFGSRNPIKLGLHVDIGRYTPGQRFLGLTSLVLDNHFQDRSFLREALAMGLLRRLGHPAPREAFVQLAINGVYQGLYSIVEPVTSEFVEDALGETGGTLFEYHWVFPFYGQDLGNDLAAWRPLFEPQGATNESEEALYGPLRDLFRDVNDPDEDGWQMRIEQRIDLPELLQYVGAEAFLAELDGFLGYAGMNNFFVYRHAGTARHRVLAWDRDFAFTFLDSPIDQGAADNVLVRRALERPELRAMFLDGVEAAAMAALDDDWLATEIERHAALITASALKDHRKPFTNQEFFDAVDFLRTFAAVRPAFTLEAVALARQE
jgi:spore coat protein CotH